MNKILVVDDDPTIRGLLQVFLQGEGFVVATAEDGEKALEVLRRKSGWVIFTDLNMPRMGGIELIKQLERNPRWRQENVIAVMSARNLSVDQIASYLSSEVVKAFMPKPFELSMLLKIAELLTRQITSTGIASLTEAS